jgi:hypothetical protein
MLNILISSIRALSTFAVIVLRYKCLFEILDNLQQPTMQYDYTECKIRLKQRFQPVLSNVPF